MSQSLPIGPVSPIPAVSPVQPAAAGGGAAAAASPNRLLRDLAQAESAATATPDAAGATGNAPRSDGLKLVAGKASFAVAVGERLLGFSREEVRSLQLEAQSGSLKIQLLAADQRLVGEIRAPGPEQLRARLDQLAEQGIHFKAQQARDLANLMKLSMARGVSKTDLVLMLDEVSHLAPQAAPATGLDPSSLFPELSHKVKELLAAMPQEIQNTVLLFNREHFSRESWDALALASKVDRQRDAALARFLEGRGPLNFEAEAQLKSVATRQSLEVPVPIEKLDPEAFLQLAARFKHEPSRQQTREFSASVTQFAIQHFELEVPNFSSEQSFDQLATKIELRARALASNSESASLDSYFKANLDTTQYKKLNAFLSGQPDVKMDTEVLAEAIHLIRHPNPQPRETIGSIAPHSLERLTQAMRATSPQLDALIAARSAAPVQAEHPGSTESLFDFKGLQPEEKLAVYVLDHIDPVREPNLYLYFDGKNRLSKMTPVMQDELLQFLDRSHFPKVSGQLNGLEFDKIHDLLNKLSLFPDRVPPAEYLPHKESLLALVQRLKAERAGEVPEVKDNQVKLEGEIPLLDRLARIPAQAGGASPEGRELLISQTLRRFSPRFPELSLIDQVLGANHKMRQILEQKSLDSLPDLGMKIRTLAESARGQVPETQSWLSASDDPLQSLEFKSLDSKVLKNLESILKKTSGFQRVAQLEQWLKGEGGELFGEKTRRQLSARLENWLRGMASVRDKQGVFGKMEEGIALMHAFIADAGVAREERIAAFEAGLKGKNPEQRNEKITEFLRENLPQFRRVALLDQLWRVERLSGELPKAGSGMGAVSKELAHSLQQLAILLEDRERPAPHWELIDLPRVRKEELGEAGKAGQGRVAREMLAATADPRPDLKEILLHEEGSKRYFKMDESLPERAPKLADRLEELGLVKRVQELAHRVDSLRSSNVGELLDSLSRQQGLLKRLAKLALEGDVHDWSFQSKSPLSTKKERQFQEVRDQILAGSAPELEPLFEAPFLRGAFGEAAERAHEQEMARLEPAFKDALKRAFADPEQQLNQLLRGVQGQGSEREIKHQLRETLEQFHGFNQQQNLNQMPLYMGFPLAMNNRQGAFEMAYLRLPTENKRKDRFMVVVHLDFADWGHLRVDAVKDREHLTATFWAENHKMHRLLLHQLHLLEDRMEDLELGEVQFQTKLSPAKASQSLADLCLPPDGALDFSA